MKNRSKYLQQIQKLNLVNNNNTGKNSLFLQLFELFLVTCNFSDISIFYSPTEFLKSLAILAFFGL